MRARRRKMDWRSFGLGALSAWVFRGGLRTVAGKLGLVLFGLFALWGYAMAQWHALPPAGQWGLGLLAATLVVMWLRHRAGRLSMPRWGSASTRATPQAGWLPRTTSDPFWVYVISEWRDGKEYLLSREDGRMNGTAHLVYVGKANDFERRMEQHQADKAWWHDHLEFRVIRCFTEDEALKVERGIIERAAQSSELHKRPRENKAMNPSYSAARCSAMRAKAVTAAVAA